MIHALWTTYVAVLAAEIVGDKLPYTAAILATRYRRAPILTGMAIAFMVKMGVAVAVGDTIRTFARPAMAGVTLVTCLWIGLRLWHEHEEQVDTQADDARAHGVLVSCVSVLGSEWADLGQVAAATMAAQYHVPLLVWLGAVGAMMTKATLAATIGVELRTRLHRYVPERVVRYAGLSLLLLLGGASAAETLFAR